MIPIENLPRLFDIKAVLGLCRPRNFKTNVDIVPDYSRFGRAVGSFGKTDNLLVKLFADFIRKLRLFYLFVIFINFFVAVHSKLVLNHLQLLTEIIVTLTVVNLLADFFMYCHFAFQKLGFAFEENRGLFETFERLVNLKHSLPVLGTHQYVERDEVRKKSGILYRVHCRKNIVGNCRYIREYSVKGGEHLGSERFGAYVGERRVDDERFCEKIGIYRTSVSL